MIAGGLKNTRLVAVIAMALYHKNPGKRFAVQYRGDDAYFTNVSTKELIGDVDLKEMGINYRGSILYPPNRLEGVTVVTQHLVRDKLGIIVATDDEGGIGKDNTIPWKSPSDMKNFAKVTAGKVLIMGRKTFESLPPRGLPGRTLIVVSNSLRYQPGQTFKLVSNLKEAIALAEFISDDRYFVIGGARMFEEALPYASEIHLAHIEGNFNCDVKWPAIREKSLSSPADMSIVTYTVDPAVEGKHGELHVRQYILEQR